MTKKKDGWNRMRLKLSEIELIKKHRANTLENINDNSALDLHLQERGIDKKRRCFSQALAKHGWRA